MARSFAERMRKELESLEARIQAYKEKIVEMNEQKSTMSGMIAKLEKAGKKPAQTATVHRMQHTA